MPRGIYPRKKKRAERKEKVVGIKPKLLEETEQLTQKVNKDCVAKSKQEPTEHLYQKMYYEEMHRNQNLLRENSDLREKVKSLSRAVFNLGEYVLNTTAGIDR